MLPVSAYFELHFVPLNLASEAIFEVLQNVGQGLVDLFDFSPVGVDVFGGKDLVQTSHQFVLLFFVLLSDFVDV